MSRALMRENTTARFSQGWVPARVRDLKKEEGTNLLEYGLVAILFMTLMFGLMGLGQMLYGYHFVGHAAKSAARWAAVNGATCGAPTPTCPSCDNSCNGTNLMNNGPASASDIATYVTNITPQGIDSTQVTVNSTWPVQTSSPTICSAGVTGVSATPIPNYPGCTVEVQVSYNFNWFFPLGNSSSVTMSSSSEMVVSH
jgi:Flp pilus assembly protein TadG